MIRLSILAALLSSDAMACGTTGLSLMPLDKDAPLVEVFLDDMKLAQPFSVKVKVCSDMDIMTLSVDANMPAHQHGMNYTPTVVELGNGAFRVDGMVFHMPGIWEIQLELGLGSDLIRYTQTTTLE